MISSNDLKYMRMAINQARKGVGRTRPNPPVGAVVVRDAKVVGRGYHKRAGTPHAEVHALTAAGGLSRGATVYVTLEPCNHTGRTPPCTRALLEAGVVRVVIGAMDPNPKVAGGGADFLRARGVEVDVGCLERECQELVAPFAKHFITGMPWVTVKTATTLDGRIATRTGQSQWITNDKARKMGHGLRDRLDAILVGRKTVAADDPSLTCWANGRARDPVRVVLDSTLSMDPKARMLNQESDAPTIIIGSRSRADQARRRTLEAAGARVVLVGSDARGVDLQEALASLSEMEIQSVLVEGGGEVIGSFFDQGLVDELYSFVAPMIFGGTQAPVAVKGNGTATIEKAPRLMDPGCRRLGDNWMIHGWLRDLGSFWRR